MLERIMKLLSSLKLDIFVQGFLFLLLMISIYWFLPGLTIILSPIAIFGFISKAVYDFVKNKTELIY